MDRSVSQDSYFTIADPVKASIRERSSKFISYAFPIRDPDEGKTHVDALKKEFYDATHHCWAWRLGVGESETTRCNDDGEPSGTAGRPILGQILCKGVTDVMVVVVRYFGGTKLGLPGLIAAYREAAAEVLEECTIIEKTVNRRFRISFPYTSMNMVMKVIKDMEPEIVSQNFDNTCSMELSIRMGMACEMEGKLRKCEGITITD